MTDQPPPAGTPSAQPVERGWSSWQQWFAGILSALLVASIVGMIAGKTKIEVLETRVLVLEATIDGRDERERAAADRLARMEGKIDALLQRVDRVEVELRSARSDRSARRERER